MLASALTVIAIVTQDQSALRAAPKDSAAQQAVLWQGDSLEIRGEKGDFLQVYDHRRERPGYIRASQVRVQSLRPEAAPELFAVVRFLRDTPGAEALGIGYAAAYLRAAPAEAINGTAFDALGTLAERLAQRASGAAKSGKAAETLAAHLEVAAHYGVVMRSHETESGLRLCYDGEAQRRVLALPATPSERARAALALTRPECRPAPTTPSEAHAHDLWRADILERIDSSELPPVLKNRLRLRQAGIWSALAFQRVRRAEPGASGVLAAGNRALNELAAVDKSELMESDLADYHQAAIRVGAARWAAEPTLSAASGPSRAATPELRVHAGEPGQSCIHLVEAHGGQERSVFSRCTYGQVWPASFSLNPERNAATLAVQPTEEWRELWVLRKTEAGWSAEVLPPAADAPGLGYIEFAGWMPGGTHVLAARETAPGGRPKQSFEVLRLADLQIEKRAEQPSSLSPFYRWQSPLWKAKSIALR